MQLITTELKVLALNFSSLPSLPNQIQLPDIAASTAGEMSKQDN